jgi:hypothetical protein
MLALTCAMLLIGCGGGSSSDGGSTPPPASEEPVSLDAAVAYWNGDWYGWWTWSNGTGEAAQLNGGEWDCQAELSTGADGKGHLVIWDQDWGKDDGITEVDYTVTAAGGPLGTLTSDSGWFINRDDFIAQGTWVLDAAAQGAENFIVIKGHYASTSDPSTSFDYTIYLRPWGTSWDDAPVAAPASVDWYNGAKSGEMPDVIGQ